MPTDEDLHAKIEAAVLEEVRRVGPGAINKMAIIQRVAPNAEVSQATLYRWIGAVLIGPKPAKTIKAAVDKAAKRRVKTATDPATAAAREAVAELPRPISIAAEISSVNPSSDFLFIKRLQECLATADKLAKHALTEEGNVRNSKLLLQASEHIRRTLETAARIQEALIQFEQIERFDQAVFDMLREESPALAERVLPRLWQLNERWATAA